MNASALANLPRKLPSRDRAGLICSLEPASGSSARPTTRILFLDFDGVLHPLHEADEEAGGPCQYFVWLPLLAQLLAPHTDVGIVVHSTWRYIYTDDELRRYLEPLGERVLGTTPRGPRHESIRWFLNANRWARNHLIVDDAPEEFATPLPPELVVCDSRKGISDPAVQRALMGWLGRG